ncbi:serine/threonine-protein kinase 11-interacting protein isoform X2 [Neocloeon triangulifer]|uniref:serine/threonine-protein kinase 11-interacting protein isoform X2 n=1 Tax=Neocloeon triangulifer TaxID=2078957 RepID=UPI00286EC263|nr:serine/threonine-protein kinase 11-interacting protein isoform X2 [Neocloeon triangulifer]
MIGSDVQALSSLLRAHGDKILSGGQRLTLTAALAQKLSAAFCLITSSAEQQNNDSLSFQVVTHSSSNARLHDLHFLHDFVQRVEALKLTHGSDTLQGNLDLAKFRNLKHLELEKVPLHMVSGLSILQPRLVFVSVSKSISHIEDLLGHKEWPDLHRLSLPHNTLSALDASFAWATSLKEVDLRHNVITKTDGLELLPNLVVLDLSYNHLSAVPKLHKNTSRTLKHFAIAHNNLEQLNGLEQMYSLEVFHCGWNCLVETHVLASTSKLPRLKKLWMSGNPLMRAGQCRERIARRLHPCIIPVADFFLLDGKVLSEQERRWIGAACIDINLSPPATALDSGEASSSSLSQSVSRKPAKVREVVIADIDEAPVSPNNTSFTSTNASIDTVVETKKQIESLREKLGESWLGGVTGVLGLPSDQNESGNVEERFEAEAWLDSQQKPSSSYNVQIENIAADNQIEEEPGENQSSAEQDNSFQLHGEASFVTVECDPFLSESMLEPTSSALPIDSGTEHLNDSDEDEDESGDEAPFLVQREIQISQKNTIVKDYFVIIGTSKIVEREASGKISAQWPLDCLVSCEHRSATNVFLTFDTIRRDKQNRDFLLEADDALELVKVLNSILEARSLGEMNQAVFRCMRCSTHFSSEISDLNSTVGRCPSCNSAVVVQEDVMTRSSAQPKQPVIHELPTEHRFNPIHQKKSSIGSLLDQSMSDSGLGLIAGQSRHHEGNDSDIEVLSNPSQSSIEIIPPSEESHSREESAAPTSSVESRVISINISSHSPPIATNSSSS